MDEDELQLDEPGDDEQLRRWRFDQLAALGFGDDLSALMAQLPVDLGEARRLISLGCPPEMASQILL